MSVVSLRNLMCLRTAQTQTLTMTPQLQQAIRLLQLSTLDLKQEIQQTLESNPMLEVDDTTTTPNVESLDALAEREQAQNADGDVYNPFSDDPSACISATPVQGGDIGENGAPLSTAEVLSRDSSMHRDAEHDFNYSNDSSFGEHADYGDGGDFSSSDFGGGAESSHDLAGEALSAVLGDNLPERSQGTESASSSSPDVAESNFGNPDGEFTDIDTSSMSSEDLDMAYDLAHLEASPENNSSTPAESDLPDRIATSENDPGEGSTLDNDDNFMRDDNYSAKSRSKGVSTDDDGFFEGETQLNLREHLLWQLDCSPIKGRDRAIAETIIDGVDDSGYLGISLEDILDVVHETHPEATLDDVKIVLKLVQSYEPLGVAARDVQECLLIQLRDLIRREPSEEAKMAERIIENHLDLLSNHDYRALCANLGIKVETLKAINDIIVSLNPRPGRTVIREKANYIVPDVIVVKDKNGNYDVELNPEALPRVRLNEQYKSLVCYARNEREKEFFKSNLQEANWFIQSIAKRNDTLLKVSRCIVEHQKAFLDYGEQRMEPLVLNDIAQEIDMHESTISRVTTEKYIYTARGTFELKYFFSSHVSTDNGGTASSTAIRAEIKLLVANENPRRPYSDNQIANLLKEKGYCVARRTIAKYRESLGIGSSSQRKRLV